MADDGSPTIAPEDIAFARVFPNGLPATRAAHPPAIVRAFPLTEEHLAKLAAHADSGRTLGTEDHSLARLKRKHHRLAMLLAGGMEPEKAAMACGYHPTTVGILCKDPMFAELLDLYNDGVMAEFQDTIETMRELADDLIGELAARLEHNPREFTIGQMNELAKTLLDRSGNGPTSTTNLNTRVAVVDGATLERIKAAANAPRSADRPLPQLSEGHQRAIEGVFRLASPVAAEQQGEAGLGSPTGPSLRAEDSGLLDDALFSAEPPADGESA